MKMTRFIQLILCILIFSNFAQAQDYFRSFNAGHFDMYLGSEYFTSTSNYDAGGSNQSLLPKASIHNIELDTSVRYLFLDKFGVYTGIKFNNVESNNGVQARTNSALTYYSLGADLQILHSGYWSLYADGNYLIANENIDVNGDTAIASDGASEAILSAVGTFESENWRFFTKAGFDYRMEGLSALLKYGFGGDFRISQFNLGLSFEGFSSVQDDEKTSTPISRDLVTTRVNAGSRRYYAVNPNSLEGELYLQYNYDKDLSLKVYGGSTVVGSNSANGVLAGVAFNWGFGGGYRKSSANKSSLPEDEPGFKVDTNDGVNQDIFKPTNTPKK